LLRLAGEATMLEQTVSRIEPLVARDRILIITGADQAAASRALLPHLPPENVIAEPAPRDTAPCVGLAAGLVARRDPDGTMIVMPADHVIEPAAAFHETVQAAVDVIADDQSALVTFGIKPTRPETGYGYIERGDVSDMRNGISVYRVVQFREKPDNATAEAFMAAGTFAWNSGIFVWRAGTILDNIRAHRPQLAAALEPVIRALGTPAEAETMARLFPQIERISIDKAVMEPASKPGAVRMLEVTFNWNDLGDWRALAGLLQKDAAGNATDGHVLAQHTKNSIIVSDDGGLIAALGVDDLVIVQSGKATLVARKDKLDKLKELVEGLGNAGYGCHL
jgi:mannose-1-phosphate guanylyltransferase